MARQCERKLFSADAAAIINHGDAANAGRAARKERGLPAAQPVFIQGLIECRAGIVEHFHQAIDMSIHGACCGQAQLTHDGGAHRVQGKPLPLDFCSGQHLVGKRIQLANAAHRVS